MSFSENPDAWERYQEKSKFSEHEDMSNPGTGHNDGTPEETGLTPTQQAEMVDNKDTKKQGGPIISPEDFRTNIDKKLLALEKKIQENPDFLAAQENPKIAHSVEGELDKGLQTV